ncbi:sulfite exporter TauE/SafE family protein [candidate division WOR-3 bacterium]|nr:sulfite exporter TauE/SafE family protein [candidate division WOR-3 bacterium]
MIDLLITFVSGIVAGLLGGLLGIGGGIVLMPVLRFFVGLSPAFAAGTCIMAVFFTTFGGTYRHYKLGHINIRSIIPIIITGALFTIIFSLIFLYFTQRERWLDLGLGLVFSFVSIRMIIEGLPIFKVKKASGSELRGSLLQKFAVGSAAGILPGLFGIGTGAILVPAFTFVFKAPIKIAMASSLACFAVNAFLSSLFKFSQGFVDIKVAVPICLGTLIGANIGALLNKRFPSAMLKIIFGIVFSYVSLKFILSFFGIKI